MSSRNRRVLGSYADVNARVRLNDSSMDNGLMSTEDSKAFDHCCGIHGAMRERRSAKRATSAARRRHDKVVIQQALEEI